MELEQEEDDDAKSVKSFIDFSLHGLSESEIAFRRARTISDNARRKLYTTNPKKHLCSEDEEDEDYSKDKTPRICLEGSLDYATQQETVSEEKIQSGYVKGTTCILNFFDSLNESVNVSEIVLHNENLERCLKVETFFKHKNYKRSINRLKNSIQKQNFEQCKEFVLRNLQSPDSVKIIIALAVAANLLKVASLLHQTRPCFACDEIYALVFGDILFIRLLAIKSLDVANKILDEEVYFETGHVLHHTKGIFHPKMHGYDEVIKNVISKVIESQLVNLPTSVVTPPCFFANTNLTTEINLYGRLREFFHRYQQRNQRECEIRGTRQSGNWIHLLGYLIGIRNIATHEPLIIAR